MLIFSHINFVTATKPGQPRPISLAVGGQGAPSQSAARLSAKLRITHDTHLFPLSNQPQTFVLV
jgi:hypothetical protein